MKFKVGDKVQVRKDLVIGQRYFNDDGVVSDNFTIYMNTCVGITAKINEIRDGRYLLDIDAFHFYTEGMLIADKEDEYYEEEEYLLENIIDDYEDEEVITISPKYRDEVEVLITHMLILAPEQLINGALDRGDKEAFKEIVKKYNMREIS